MRDMYGWRAKIGLLVPDTNTTIEPELNRLAPKGVSIFASRLPTLGVEGLESLVEMQKHLGGRVMSLQLIRISYFLDAPQGV